MRFRLIYSGSLPTNGGPVEKERVRSQLCPQLRALWNQPPLSAMATRLRDSPHLAEGPAGEPSLRFPVGGCEYVALVSSRLNLVAEIDVLFLRPCAPGELVRHGGDLDNRVKTLLDGLRLPSVEEARRVQQSQGTSTRFVLLEDDALITRLNVEADRLLHPPSTKDVHLVITVNILKTETTWGNMSF
jgi:hypothetical protein